MHRTEAVRYVHKLRPLPARFYASDEDRDTDMCRRDGVGEHPLEALYQARDAAQRAASHTHHTSEIPPAERASYEHVLQGLMQAVGILNRAYQHGDTGTPSSDSGGRAAITGRIR